MDKIRVDDVEIEVKKAATALREKGWECKAPPDFATKTSDRPSGENDIPAT